MAPLNNIHIKQHLQSFHTSPQYKKDIGVLEHVQRRAKRLVNEGSREQML